MSGSKEEVFVEKLKQEIGERLRVVATYDEESYQAFYIREDIDEMYTGEEREEIYRERILEGISKEYREGLYRVGELNSVVEVFDESVIFHFPKDDNTGVHISVDSDMDLHVMGIIEAVQANLDDVV